MYTVYEYLKLDTGKVVDEGAEEVPYREKHVLLVLVDSSEVGDSLGVLDHTDGLT